MFVIVAGGGRLGAQLTRSLLAQDYQVHVVEDRPAVLSRLHRELPTETIFEGKVLDPKVLEAAGIQKANVVAACTAMDELNLAMCYEARTRYHVPRTVARVNDPNHAWLFDDMFKVDVAINQADIMSKILQEEMSMGDMITLMKLRRGNYSLIEEKIPPRAQAVGVSIMNLGLTDHCVIAAVIRKGEVTVPRGVTVLEAGDEILAITDQAGANRLAELLRAREDE